METQRSIGSRPYNNVQMQQSASPKSGENQFMEILGSNFHTRRKIKVSTCGNHQASPGKINQSSTDTSIKIVCRCYVILRLYHQLALGAITIGTLNKIDKIIRGYIRKWLNLPHDIITAYFHATIKDGGLRIPSMRWTAPLLRRDRLLAAKKTYFNKGLERFAEELAKCNKRLTDHGTLLNTNELMTIRWTAKLHESIDGAGLKASADTPQQHKWISDGNRFLTGNDFIGCIRTRINALPTRSRTTRSRTENRHCRAGCLAMETLNHVLQVCHRTHAYRIKRHNAILSYMERRIKSNGYTIHREPHYKTTSGLRKLNIVAVFGKTAIVEDAQVTTT